MALCKCNRPSFPLNFQLTESLQDDSNVYKNYDGSVDSGSDENVYSYYSDDGSCHLCDGQHTLVEGTYLNCFGDSEQILCVKNCRYMYCKYNKMKINS